MVQHIACLTSLNITPVGTRWAPDPVIKCVLFNHKWVSGVKKSLLIGAITPFWAHLADGLAALPFTGLVAFEIPICVVGP